MSHSPNPNTENTVVSVSTEPMLKQSVTTTTSQPIVIEQKSSGKGVATGALVLSLIALGASGFLFVQGQNVFTQQELKVKQELANAALGESENARKLANSLDEQAKLNEIVGKLDVGQQQNRTHIADVQRAYQELLKGRVNWLVDEVEVTLNLASQQLLLSGNVPVAITVLESIDQRLSRFEQSDLLPIKKAISADLSALKSRPYLDVSGTVLKLDALEKGVPALPLLVDSTLQETATQEVATPNAADFWTRTWDKTVGVLKGMVEIRKLDTNDAMLLAPEQIYFVRSNLRLRLMDARLALLQHNGEVYKNNLDTVETTVKQYFDMQSPSTQKWLDELVALKNLDIHMVSDDALKASQSAVRQYQNNNKTANPVNLKEVQPLASVTLSSMQSMNSAPTTQTNPAEQSVTPIAASAEQATDTNTNNSVQAASQVPTQAQGASTPALETKAASGVDMPAIAPVVLPSGGAKVNELSNNANKEASSANTKETKDAPKANNSNNNKDKSKETKENKEAKKPAPKSDNKNKSDDKKANDKKADSAGK